MLERRSALTAAKPYNSSVLQLREAGGFTLTQVAGLDADFEVRLRTVLGELPVKVGKAIEFDGRTVMRVGPSQFWIIAPQADDLSGVGAVTPLSHSRVRILIDGAPARDVLSKGMSLDFHRDVFTPGTFAMTGVHHTPVLVHCIGESSFHLYALRTFAMSVWDWLTDAALEYAA
jgi:sarcosine oxidase subunit gamma